MSRIDAETQRLFRLPAEAGSVGPRFISADGRVRALVLALAGPADWALLAPLWQGVQADLGWPAPAIAVNGTDAFELWFSLLEPLPWADAAHLLSNLKQRYLADLRPDRVRLWPGADAAAQPPACPPFAAGPERWAAFVTPDLPAVFGDDPALDFEPGADAQADLLVRQRSIKAGELSRAMATLQPGEAAAPAAVFQSPKRPPESMSRPVGAAAPGAQQDARSFLLAVMNDPAAPLALRIEAAKGLLSAPGAPAP